MCVYLQDAFRLFENGHTPNTRTTGDTLGGGTRGAAPGAQQHAEAADMAGWRQFPGQQVLDSERHSTGARRLPGASITAWHGQVSLAVLIYSCHLHIHGKNIG